MSDLESLLKLNFWIESFRDWQKDMIESIINWNDTLVFMPTWWWKSLVYQLSGLVLDWIVIVISPLISLMKDQVDKLNKLWLWAKLINSSISQVDIDEILFDIQDINSSIKYLYIAPERLNSTKFIDIIKNKKISLLAIDEAHCISQWWHDFRPSYMKIYNFIVSLRSIFNFPIVALTATATIKVRKDIIERLWIKKPRIFITWFDRKNIIVIVREISMKLDKLKKLFEIIEKSEWVWIVYCSSRKIVDELYNILISHNIKVWKYTWAMKSDIRESTQEDFMNNKYKLIVATNAFWMWIDKKDIRFVVHYNLPWSIENYYQEIWRAGRDGKNSFAIVLASYSDTKIQEFFIENTYPSKEDILLLYDFLYKDFNIWEWDLHPIVMTQKEIAFQSSLWNDMKISSILKILEKFNIIKKWLDNNEYLDSFRWKGLILNHAKKNHSKLNIDWRKQELLKEEAYYKLDQIKKLLFYPSCRKRFILEYFWDIEDLKTLSDNCKACDFCLDKRKFESSKIKNIIPISVFSIVLETVKKFNEKFWVQIISKLLNWSNDKRIFEWNLDKNDFYSALDDYNILVVNAIIDWLIFENYLYKTWWKYPLVWISDLWKDVLYKDKHLKDNLDNLNTFIIWKVWLWLFKNKDKESFKKDISINVTNNKSKKIDTYEETLLLYNKWLKIFDIAKYRNMKEISIENHIIKLYLNSKISLLDIIKTIDLDNIKIIKSVIKEDLKWDFDFLKPIKECLIVKWYDFISYFDIKICIAMMEKKDI